MSLWLFVSYVELACTYGIVKDMNVNELAMHLFR
jgi:hypothetical protein